jgi:outer membrane protein assembly factor BamD
VSRSRTLRKAILGAWTLAILAGCGAHTLPEIHSETERLATARHLHAEGDDADAIELLKVYSTGASGAADVDEAIYLLGECYLAIKDWTLAANEFERMMRDYPESDSSASASFRLGQAYYGQSRKEDFDQEYTLKALDQWQSYVRANPGHWLNAEAARRILQARTRLANKLLATGTLYLKMRIYEPARFYFRQVIDQYGDTSARPPAELGLAMADARQKKRDSAVAALRDIEARYSGQAVASVAAKERKRLEH